MSDRGAACLLGATAMALVLAAAPPAAAEPADALAVAYPATSQAASVALPLILAAGALAPNPAQLEQRRTGDVPMEVRQSIGCLIVGAAGTTVTLAAGALGLVSALAGGTVAAQSTGALYLGVTGVIFGTFCAVGAIMTPLYVYLTSPRPAQRPMAQERHAAEPRVPAPTQANYVPADDVRSAAFRSGILTNALAQRVAAR